MKYDFSNPSYTRHALYLTSILSNPILALNKEAISKLEHKAGDRRSGIYVVLNMKTGDYYVGSAEDAHRRRNSHAYAMRGGVGGNVLLTRHTKKYGFDSFSFLFIHSVHKENLVEAEQFWIQSLSPFYNLTKRAIRKGCTEVGRKKIGEHARNRRDNSKYKVPVLQYSADGGFIREWDSVKAATEGVGASGGHISSACRTGKITYGYLWGYKNGMTPARPRYPQKKSE